MNELLFFLMILLFVAMALQAVLERMVARERAPRSRPPARAEEPIVVRRGPARVELERARQASLSRAVTAERASVARAEPTRGALEDTRARSAPVQARAERAAVERVERARAIAAERRARAEPARVHLEEIAVRRAPPAEAESPVAQREAAAAAEPARPRRGWLRQAVVMREVLGPPRALGASALEPVPR